MAMLYTKGLFRQSLFSMPPHHSTLNASDTALITTSRYLYPYAGTVDLTIGLSNGMVLSSGFYDKVNRKCPNPLSSDPSNWSEADK